MFSPAYIYGASRSLQVPVAPPPTRIAGVVANIRSSVRGWPGFAKHTKGENFTPGEWGQIFDAMCSKTPLSYTFINDDYLDGRTVRTYRQDVEKRICSDIFLEKILTYFEDPECRKLPCNFVRHCLHIIRDVHEDLVVHFAMTCPVAWTASSWEVQNTIDVFNRRLQLINSAPTVLGSGLPWKFFEHSLPLGEDTVNLAGLFDIMKQASTEIGGEHVWSDAKYAKMLLQEPGARAMLERLKEAGERHPLLLFVEHHECVTFPGTESISPKPPKVNVVPFNEPTGMEQAGSGLALDVNCTSPKAREVQQTVVSQGDLDSLRTDSEPWVRFYNICHAHTFSLSSESWRKLFDIIVLRECDYDELKAHVSRWPTSPLVIEGLNSLFDNTHAIFGLVEEYLKEELHRRDPCSFVRQYLYVLKKTRTMLLNSFVDRDAAAFVKKLELRDAMIVPPSKKREDWRLDPWKCLRASVPLAEDTVSAVELFDFMKCAEKRIPGLFSSTICDKRYAELLLTNGFFLEELERRNNRGEQNTLLWWIYYHYPHLNAPKPPLKEDPLWVDDPFLAWSRHQPPDGREGRMDRSELFEVFSRRCTRKSAVEETNVKVSEWVISCRDLIFQGTCRSTSYLYWGYFIPNIDTIPLPERLLYIVKVIDTPTLLKEERDIARKCLWDLLKGGVVPKLGLPIQHLRTIAIELGVSPLQLVESFGHLPDFLATAEHIGGNLLCAFRACYAELYQKLTLREARLVESVARVEQVHRLIEKLYVARALGTYPLLPPPGASKTHAAVYVMVAKLREVHTMVVELFGKSLIRHPDVNDSEVRKLDDMPLEIISLSHIHEKCSSPIVLPILVDDLVKELSELLKRKQLVEQQITSILSKPGKAPNGDDVVVFRYFKELSTDSTLADIIRIIAKNNVPPLTPIGRVIEMVAEDKLSKALISREKPNILDWPAAQAQLRDLLGSSRSVLSFATATQTFAADSIETVNDYAIFLSREKERDSCFQQGLSKVVLGWIQLFVADESLFLRRFREVNRTPIVSRKLSQGQQLTGRSRLEAAHELDLRGKLLAAVDTLQRTVPLPQAESGLYSFEALYDALRRLPPNRNFVQELLDIGEAPLAQLEASLSLRQTRVTSALDIKLEQLVFRGHFYCETTDRFDSPEGLREAVKVLLEDDVGNIVRGSEPFHLEELDDLFGRLGLTPGTWTPHQTAFAKTYPLLRQISELGIECLRAGLQPADGAGVVVLSTEYDCAVKMTGAVVNERPAFVLDTNAGRGGTLLALEGLQGHLGNFVQELAVMLETFQTQTAKLQSASSLAFFTSHEIGKLLRTVLRTHDFPQKNDAIVKLRLGNNDFGKNAFNIVADNTPPIEGLCDLMRSKLVPLPSRQRVLPMVLELDAQHASQWPLDVVRAYQTFANNRLPQAFELALPIGPLATQEAQLVSFFHKASHPMAPQESVMYTAVVVGRLAESPAVRTLLDKKLSGAYPSQVLIITTLSKREWPCKELRRSQLHPELPTPREWPQAVVGPHNSGKLAKCLDILTQARLGVSSTFHFINGATAPHELHGTLRRYVRAREGAVLEVGCDCGDEAQALILSTILPTAVWPMRDGEAAYLEHRHFVYKVNDAFDERLPVLKLLKRSETSAATTGLGSLYRQLAERLSPGEALKRQKELTERALMVQTTRTLTKYDRSNAHQIVGSEIPDALLTWVGPDNTPTASIFSTANLMEFELPGGCVKMHDPVSGAPLDSQTLWASARHLLSSALDLSLVEGKVMTPTLLQCLVRLDVSVRSSGENALSACDAPVVFCGDTGCGKTELMHIYGMLKGIEVKVLNVDSSTTPEDIYNWFSATYHEWKAAAPKRILIFVDEFNTSSAQDCIKRALCDRWTKITATAPVAHNTASAAARTASAVFSDQKIPSTAEGWVMVAACNPYETVRSDDGITSLKFAVQAEISPSMIPRVWSLPDPKDQETCEIVKAMCKACNTAKGDAAMNDDDIDYFSQWLPKLHRIIRDSRADRHIPVSFRTASCALRFHIRLPNVLSELQTGFADAEAPESRAFRRQLTLAVVYYAGLSSTRKDIDSLGCGFAGVLRKAGEIVKRSLPPQLVANVERAVPSKKLYANSSFLENLACAFLCVHTSTPVILVGPPGSSKSLASYLVVWGKIENLADITTLFYQCGRSSTVWSVYERMYLLHKIQLEGPSARAVALFDEIGHADLSPERPLKVLHKYLERSVFVRSAGGQQAVISDELDADGHHIIAEPGFLGTSNFSIDRALLSRVVVCQGNNPGEEELAEILGQKVASTLRFAPITPAARQPSIGVDCKALVTMRDVYALRNDRFFVEIPGTSEARTKASLDSIEFSDRRLQMPLMRHLGRRGGLLLQETNVCNARRVEIREAVLAHERLLAISDRDVTAPPEEQQCFQSKQRPLLIRADSLQLLLAALSVANLRPYTDGIPAPELRTSSMYKIVFGAWLSTDVTLFSTVMMEIKDCMAYGLVCVLVNCEYIFDSLFDVLNGFYQTDGSVSRARVVCGGESELWEVSPGFLVICAVTNRGDGQYQTPAFESRFEAREIHLDTFEGLHRRQCEGNRAAACEVAQQIGIVNESDRPTNDELFEGYSNFLSFGLSSAPSHGEIVALLHGLVRVSRLAQELGKSAVKANVVVGSLLRAKIDAQLPDAIVRTFLAQTKNKNLCVICRHDDMKSDDRALNVGRHFGGLVGTRAPVKLLRCETPDAVLHVLLQHLAAQGRNCVIVLSSQQGSISGGTLFALCHLIDQVTRPVSMRCVLLVPSVHQLSCLSGWSYCVTDTPRATRDVVQENTALARQVYARKVTDLLHAQFPLTRQWDKLEKFPKNTAFSFQLTDADAVLSTADIASLFVQHSSKDVFLIVSKYDAYCAVVLNALQFLSCNMNNVTAYFDDLRLVGTLPFEGILRDAELDGKILPPLSVLWPWAGTTDDVTATLERLRRANAANEWLVARLTEKHRMLVAQALLLQHGAAEEAVIVTTLHWVTATAGTAGEREALHSLGSKAVAFLHCFEPESLAYLITLDPSVPNAYDSNRVAALTSALNQLARGNFVSILDFTFEVALSYSNGAVRLRRTVTSKFLPTELSRQFDIYCQMSILFGSRIANQVYRRKRNQAGDISFEGLAPPHRSDAPASVNLFVEETISMWALKRYLQTTGTSVPMSPVAACPPRSDDASLHARVAEVLATVRSDAYHNAVSKLQDGVVVLQMVRDMFFARQPAGLPQKVTIPKMMFDAMLVSDLPAGLSTRITELGVVDVSPHATFASALMAIRGWLVEAVRMHNCAVLSLRRLTRVGEPTVGLLNLTRHHRLLTRDVIGDFQQRTAGWNTIEISREVEVFVAGIPTIMYDPSSRELAPTVEPNFFVDLRIDM